jgi:MerR family transcriptional regulator, mercuric resistance operon regulatory protein
MEGAGRITIGRLSTSTGTKVETIRYYERVGLLAPPARSPGGYRLYGPGHRKRLTFIRRARALGFSLAEVRTLLALADQRRRPCADVRTVAAAHLQDVKRKIADLRRMEGVLEATVARCDAGSGSHCPMIDAFYTDGDPARRRDAGLDSREAVPRFGRIRRTSGGPVASKHPQ